MAIRGPRWWRRLLSPRRRHPTAADTGAPDALACPLDGASWAAGASHPGQTRGNNEDAFLCDPERKLFVVADGLGGRAAGELASQTAIAAVSDSLSADRIAGALRGSDEDVQGLLAACLEEANERIVRLARTSQAQEGMASTATIALVSRGRLHVANLGDSRAYLVRDRQARVLTRDHSVAAVLQEQGQLTAEEARRHRTRNLLTELLGRERPVVPAYVTATLEAGDRIVLCSDGLWDRVSDGEISVLAGSAAEPRGAVEALIRAANLAGGPDNITVIAVFVTPALGAEETLQPAHELTAEDGQAEPAGPGRSNVEEREGGPRES